MINEKQLNAITSHLRDVILDEDVFYNSDIRGSSEEERKDFNWEYPQTNVDLVEIILSLHSLLYECVKGEKYDYWFHWINKHFGGCPDLEDYFNDIIKEDK